MIKKPLALFVGTSLLAIGSVASAQPLAAISAAAIEHHDKAETTEAEKLKALFAKSDEDSLKRNPIGALFRGDERYADQLGDYISDEYFAKEKAAETAELAALMKIDRSKLSATDKIAYDVFKRDKQQALKGYSDEIMALTVVRPVNHFSGFHTFYPNFASGKGGAPFKTVKNYEDNLKRHKQFIVIGDRSIERFREGMKSGVVETKLTINNVIEQLATQIGLGLEDSPFMAPTKNFPEDFSEEDKARLTREYSAATQEIFAGYQRMHDFLKNEYLPVAREGVGLSAMKGGDVLYENLIENTTTLPLKADYIHNLGLSEVNRIKTEMEEIKAEVGYDGTLSEFFEYLRTDPTARVPASSISTPMTCPRAAPPASPPSICTKARRAIISRFRWPRKIPTCRTSCALVATPPLSRAGRSMPRSSASRWDSTPTPISASAISTTRCSARCGWSSIPACTARAGPATRRSSICSTTAAWARPTPPPKSNAISRSRRRRWPTRSAR